MSLAAVSFAAVSLPPPPPVPSSSLVRKVLELGDWRGAATAEKPALFLDYEVPARVHCVYGGAGASAWAKKQRGWVRPASLFAR
eukprot:gene1293-8994_t